ncbi:pyridoxal phosphate-dependent aminotransferase [Methanocalculus sp.]|uniref:pyridoxal phosphate-dependent aminotransferase n=1 Tax=Methanocalculus sp. TaxID=2004547 RepID=UPI002716A950|nr:pyridoxal phosphate-dependent aminotransferase [Methanocalculus sp.]MDO8840920.1 pyridoxal phosphate-dependent aminotransferase [Methanocalculus sp.]
MKFADRVLNLEISGIRKIFESAGPNAISLALGQPDFDTPLHIKEAAIRAIQDGKTGYTQNSGIPELREAISSKFRNENGLRYSPSEIIVTAGASEALHIAMQAMINPGDRVVFSDPGFVSYGALAELAGGRADPVPLGEDLRIDLNRTYDAIDGARMVVLNSPANPTGIVESKDTIRGIVEYADDQGTIVISDEVYEHFIYEGKHYSAAAFGDNVITINATSKTYAMTGWRLGLLAAPLEIVEECIKVHQYVIACAPSISQYAALAGYTGDQSVVTAMRDEYRIRRDMMAGGLKEMGFDFKVPEGAFYLFVPMRKEQMEAIISAGVIIVPGTAFGEKGSGYARISYAASQDALKEALNRIRNVV